MTSPPSGSEPRETSSAFDRLHEGVRRWIWQRGWNDLKDIQEDATHAILDRRGDIIISAATASGKTEAAYFPICSRLADDSHGSIRSVYVGPLKALINDQFQRLEDLCAGLSIPVHRWHGDVAATRKKEVFAHPGGILLITPESLEALFIHRGPHLAALFAGLETVVIDELHAFIGTCRGRQLQSQLHRIEHVIARRVNRIGLSATLGDMSLACEYLRPRHGAEVVQIVSTVFSQELRIQVRGYAIHPEPPPESARQLEAGEVIDLEAEDALAEQPDEVAAHLFKVLRGGNHLVFASSRARVEQLADRLRHASEDARVPNEFYPHHGLLSRELRNAVETDLREGGKPMTVVCTSTLEMGIDIGTVASVGQVGRAMSVASLRQRLGRSGRRGEAAILRAYIEEQEIDSRAQLGWELRIDLVETVAMIRLLLQRWCEPPNDRALHLSTLVQQLVSAIAQHGGLTAGDAWSLLCDDGPFGSVDKRLFADVLKSLGRVDVLSQEPIGTLLLGIRGEKLVNHYSIYAAFPTPLEYRIVSGGTTLGTVTEILDERTTRFIIFAGRRWKVLSVDHDRRLVEVSPARAGRVVRSRLSWETQIHDRVRQEMFAVYQEQDHPVFLDAGARGLLTEGRDNFARRSLHHQRLLHFGEDVAILPWKGSRVVSTLSHILAARKIEVTNDGFMIAVHAMDLANVSRVLREIAEQPAPDPAVIAADMDAPSCEKFDGYLTTELRRAERKVRDLDVEGAHRAACEIVGAGAVARTP